METENTKPQETPETTETTPQEEGIKVDNTKKIANY